VAQQAAIQSIETKENLSGTFLVDKKLKMHSKTKALELLCRNLGILKDVGGTIPGGNVNVYPQFDIVFQDVVPTNGDEQLTNRKGIYAGESSESD
jgi:hypothetical protein